ncbi:MAG: agmatinase family protein [Alphaproteobacteria bacterium]|nr:agmatinase family protein [Alphaproteobacteria bacterium]
MSAFDPDAPASLDDGLYGLGDDPETAGVVVIPVPVQATTSYRRGTRDGPEAVLAASLQVDLTDRECGDAWRGGIAMVPLADCPVAAWDRAVEADALAVIAAGGATPALAAEVLRVDAFGEQVNAWVYRYAVAALARGAVPAVLGGDHSAPFGNLQAVAEAHKGVGVLHVDAHADLRPAYEGFRWSHASIFYNAVTRLEGLGPLVQVAVRDFGQVELDLIRARADVHTFFDADLAWQLAGGAPWRRLVERILEPLPPEVYVSVDIDGLDPALCPNTGTPVPGGLSWHQLAVLLRALVESGRRIVGFDLCEVAPGDVDALVGARVLYKLANWALVSQRG